LRSDDVQGVFRIKDMASVTAALVKGETVIPQSATQRR
jgi:hypothetical protein